MHVLETRRLKDELEARIDSANADFKRGLGKLELQWVTGRDGNQIPLISFIERNSRGQLICSIPLGVAISVDELVDLPKQENLDGIVASSNFLEHHGRVVRAQLECNN